MPVSQWSDLPLVLTSDQAAQVLQVSRRTLTNMLDRGTLRGVKIGKEWRVSRDELMRFVEGHGTPRPTPAAPTPIEEAPALVEKDGLLVVRSAPLKDLSDIINEEREHRIAELLREAGL